MVWTIPYTFTPGTKARANEVNSNFTSLKQFVDQLEVNGATNEINITNLENNKANINGSNTELFNVADATTNYNAVNLQTLNNLTLNTKDAIKGFKLSIFDSNTITATAGSCYDSTYAYMITSTTSLQEQDQNLNANATYYVYVCADKDTSTNELVFNSSPTTPALPVDFDYFRRLGYFTTDDDGNIERVINDTETNVIPESELKEDSGYIEFPNGFKIQWGYLQATGTNSSRSVSFPIPFTKFARVTVTPNYVQNRGDWDTGLAGATVNGLTSFTLYRAIVDGDGGCTWIAVGV